jgi:hypothetical protein
MTAAVFDFKAIKRKVDRKEQKAEFEAKNPPELHDPWGMYGVPMPFSGPNVGFSDLVDQTKSR